MVLGMVMAVVMMVWCVFIGAFRVGRHLCDMIGWSMPIVYANNGVDVYFSRWLLGFIIISSLVWAPMLGRRMIGKSDES
jgi:hypothetical protein